MKFEDFYKEKWYIQTFNATPALIHFAALSMNSVMKSLGYSYSKFIKIFRNDVCSMYYSISDLHRLAHEFEGRITKDPEYLNKLIKTSEQRIAKLLEFIKKIDLNSYSDNELFKKYNELKLNKIWRAIKKENKGKDNFNDKLKTLILMDDIVGQLPRTRDNCCYKIERNHKHYGVSSIFI